MIKKRNFENTKIQFRVKAPKNSILNGNVIMGWQQLQIFGQGVMHDREDPTLISICFFDEPDSYCKIENVALEEYKQRVKEAIKKCVKIYEDEDGEYPDMMDSEMLLKELGLEDEE